MRRALQLPGVKLKTGLGRSRIYGGMAEGWFPKNFDLIPGGKAKAWDEDEIEEFLDKRKSRAQIAAPPTAKGGRPLLNGTPRRFAGASERKIR